MVIFTMFEFTLAVDCHRLLGRAPSHSSIATTLSGKHERENMYTIAMYSLYFLSGPKYNLTPCCQSPWVPQPFSARVPTWASPLPATSSTFPKSVSSHCPPQPRPQRDGHVHHCQLCGDQRVGPRGLSCRPLVGGVRQNRPPAVIGGHPGRVGADRQEMTLSAAPTEVAIVRGVHPQPDSGALTASPPIEQLWMCSSCPRPTGRRVLSSLHNTAPDDFWREPKSPDS